MVLARSAGVPAGYFGELQIVDCGKLGMKSALGRSAGVPAGYFSAQPSTMLSHLDDSYA
jgi:hypothetical protein